jgi:hypothetical protein
VCSVGEGGIGIKSLRPLEKTVHACTAAGVAGLQGVNEVLTENLAQPGPFPGAGAVDSAGSMIDEATNCAFRGTFVVEGGQERGGDIVDVEYDLHYSVSATVPVRKPGRVVLLFFGPLDGRMVEQEFFQNGGGM